MIRILQCVNNMNRAGLETMLMNYYRHIDRDLVQFDFLTHRPERGDYDDEIEQLGGRVYYAPRLYPQNYPAYFSYMKRFFAEHPEYRIVHSHIDAMSYLPLLAAKKAGIPVRIAHSHSTAIDRDFKYLLKQYFRMRLPYTTNTYMTCGTEAGKFLFGDRNSILIPNAVDAGNFHFDAEVRQKKRQQLGLRDEFVIGHVGRLTHLKNHRKLIKIFAVIEKICPDSRLMLVGTGEKESEIREQVKALGLEQKVMLLGSRSDVSELYQVMDVFVLPSLFEGVPVVGIEAQFADLPCIFSENVPGEVAFNPKATFVGLQEPAERWADIILQTKSAKREIICSDHYDIRRAYKILQDYYLSVDEQLDKKCYNGVL